MTNTFPFTFAWVNSTQTTFDPATMAVFDEHVLDFDLHQEEGQIPTLDLTIRNPRVGLLAPGRKTWAWLAWQSPADDPDYAGALVPLFFGVLVGVPDDLFQEKVKLKLVSRKLDFISQKQAVADAMKVAPYYDPIWFDATSQNDADAILEGWSSLWHVDRTSLAVTASDILVGEDGTKTFSEGIAFYDSVSLRLDQPPLTTVRVEATVTWKQTTSGHFVVPTVNILSYTGETFLSGWPKPGGGFGGGYTVSGSFVNDIYRVALTPQTNYQSSWNNSDPNPGQCSNAAASSSSSGPALLSPDPLNNVLTGQFKTGVCFPDSDPPLNVPATTSVTGQVVPLWALACDMTLRYDANREYSEVVVFDMKANTQAVLTAPLISQESEIITMQSVDLSKPIQQVSAWTKFRSHSVGIAQVIFPNNPTTVGGLSHQICVQAGVAGAVEPVFSDFPGNTTADGSVVWASLGQSPLTDATQWQAGSYVPVGQIMNLHAQTFNPATGDYEVTPGATSYYLCIGAGQTNGRYHTFAYTPTVTSNDDVPPADRIISVIDPPTFSTSAGSQISDGSVRWLVLGKNPPSLSMPIGGSPGDVTANNYFPTARGIASIQFLIAKARARLRLRARAVEVSWQAPFRYGVALSCRKNATLFDPRIPGGACTGKITKYSLRASGSGELRMEVSIGCSVGFGNSIAEVTGTPVYAAEGYAQKGWQVYEGAMVVHGAGDITFQQPRFSAFDDGLVFPLKWAAVSDGGVISGSKETQKDVIEASFLAAQELRYRQAWTALASFQNGINNSSVSGLSGPNAWKVEDEGRAFLKSLTPAVMAANAVSWSAVLKPCDGNGPFEGAYSISVGALTVPQGIDLEAPSSL